MANRKPSAVADKVKKTGAIQKVLTDYRSPVIVFLVLITLIGLKLAFHSSSPTDYYSQGIMDMHQSKFDQAIADFGSALRQDPADPAARFGLAWAYHSKGWLNEAAKEYREAIKRSSSVLTMTYFNLALILQKKGQANEAAGLYLKAIQLDPSVRDARLNLGLIYLRQNNDKGALSQFQVLLKFEPKNALVLYNAGVASQRLGYKEQAKSYLSTALKYNSSLKDAKNRLKALGG